jgi:hypothetical protein
MKRLIYVLIFWCSLCALSFAEPNTFHTGNDIAADVKLAVRWANGTERF